MPSTSCFATVSDASDSAVTKLPSIQPDNSLRTLASAAEATARTEQQIADCAVEVTALQQGDTQTQRHLNAETQGYRAMPVLLAALVLLAGSFGLTLFSLQMAPLEEWRYAVALCLVLGTTCAFEVAFEAWRIEDYPLFTAAFTGTIAFFTAHWFLAKARAVMIAEYVHQSAVSVVQGTGLDDSVSANDFDLSLLRILSVCLPVLAIGVELGLACAYHYAITTLTAPDRVAARRVRSLKARVARLYGFRARCRSITGRWNSWGAALESKKGAQRRLLRRIAAVIVPILLALLLITAASEQLKAAELPQPTQVFLVDYSLSESADEVWANVRFIHDALALAEPGSRQVVALITSDSWGRPKVVFDVRVTADPGFMRQNIRIAREALQRGWDKVAANIHPTEHDTDVAGAFTFIHEFLNTSASQPVRIYLLSDCRQTRGLNLEALDAARLAVTDPSMLPGPSLNGATVFVEGVQTKDRPTEYWMALRTFWVGWIRRSGGDVRFFSIGRDLETVRSPQSFPLVRPEPVVLSAKARVDAKSDPPLRNGGLRIVSPASGASCPGEMAVEVVGAPAGSEVWVIVQAGRFDEFWPNSASMKGPGVWESWIHCGRPGTGDVGVHYRIKAIANPDESIEHGVPVGDWPRASGGNSEVIEVVRR